MAGERAGVRPGAEAWSADGGPAGALLVHGFTGSPASLRGLAEVLAAAGMAVELVRLPGHGTDLAELTATRWDDWAAAVEAAWDRLAERSERAIAVGLSMGGALAAWLAARRPDVAGLVLVNPLVEPVADAYLDAMRAALDAGIEVAPSIGSDVAAPGVVEDADGGTPIAAALSLFAAVAALDAELPAVRCPVLLCSSRVDHVVPVSNGDHLISRVAGPVERVWLERSWHVATLDHDRGEIERRAVEFGLRVTGV